MNHRISLPGKLILEVISADTAALLNALSQKVKSIESITYLDDLTVRITIDKKDYNVIHTIAEKNGSSVMIIKQRGLYWAIKGIFMRPVLVTLVLVLFLLSCYLPSRILFISVDGNNDLQKNQILEVAAECGIRFGASRRLVRSESVKNALLQKLPKLRWAGINTSGCTAVISVKEKTDTGPAEQSIDGVCSIIAKRDGIIQDCVVYNGNPLCTVGQAVKAGQTLVSGYTDCGIVIKATRANAEIRALTFHEITAVSPVATEQRGEISGEKTVYALQVGKKLINFSKDSGNLGTDCAKIYEEKYLRLPGGFQLPIAIIKQTFINYDVIPQMQNVSDQPDWLEPLSRTYLKTTMVAGQILADKTEVYATGDACYLTGQYTCIEMIGQTKYEQTTPKDDNND